MFFVRCLLLHITEQDFTQHRTAKGSCRGKHQGFNTETAKTADDTWIAADLDA